MDSNWVDGSCQLVAVVVLSYLLPVMSLLKKVFEPYCTPAELNSTASFLSAIPKLLTLMHRQGSTMAMEVIPALIGCLLLSVCLIFASNWSGKWLARSFRAWALTRTAQTPAL